jgi:hypothetical protein
MAHWNTKYSHRIIARIPWLQSALNFFLNRILIFLRFFSKYLNSSTLSRELKSVFTLWLRPAFWSQDMTTCLVLSAFTSRPISLLPINKVCVVLHSMYSSIPFININSKRWYVPFNYNPSWFTWTLLMAYSKTKLKSNVDKASPCFKPFLIGNMSDKLIVLYADRITQHTQILLGSKGYLKI